MNQEHRSNPDRADYQPTDRRPLKSREAKLWNRVAARLAEAGVTANTISLMGMVFGLGAGLLLFLTGVSQVAEPGGLVFRLLWIGGAVGVQLRLLCNMLDGMVAIRAGQASAAGELYNEVPDRVSDAAILVGLGYAFASSPTLGWAATAMAIFVAYIRAVGRGGGVPQAFHGPLAKPQRMFLVTVIALAMAVLPLMWTMWSTGGAVGSIPTLTLWILIIGGAITAIRRLIYIARNLRQNTPPGGDQ